MRPKCIPKVFLNVPFIKGFLNKNKFPESLQSEMFIRNITIDDKKKIILPITYTLRYENPILINDLYDKTEQLIQKGLNKYI